ncbi:sigma-70 family RNA polymerase sigma factor [Chelatococcus sp. SYSU_G07232]|uniref:Sigma-70 family RNA polymerase sigma factor n=1 Tax=Chelatococcus albus TaxID=3047466 RepID=A0ABT7ACC5_9HYPH|nr:sigma-70 family RNA polymerase sigma factor [Chelatococcus sp. SYSU_G07232]MDJ1156682.1 sigma-70 family RNA polymerase sigma factor [Chelatococcus sp. SYSU_G07232]
MRHDSEKLALYITHRPALINYAAPIVGCRSRAEDVVQEAYLRFVQVTRDERVLQPVAYLYRIVRNLAVDWVRRLGSEVRPDVDSAGTNPIAADTPTPEEEVLYRDELRRLAEALAELPETTRIAFQMHRFDGCTLQAIAGRLGISVAGAHRLVRDALAHCARRLDDTD